MPLIKIFGPGEPSFVLETDTVTGKTSFKKAPGFEVEALTLGQALEAFGARYKSRFSPYQNQIAEIQIELGEPSKYFLFENGEHSEVVDVHVERDGQLICLKQDLAFPLEEGDVVTIGLPAC